MVLTAALAFGQYEGGEFLVKVPPSHAFRNSYIQGRLLLCDGSLKHRSGLIKGTGDPHRGFLTSPQGLPVPRHTQAGDSFGGSSPSASLNALVKSVDEGGLAAVRIIRDGTTGVDLNRTLRSAMPATAPFGVRRQCGAAEGPPPSMLRSC